MSSIAAAGKASKSFLAEPTQWSDFSFFTGKDLIVASIYRLRYIQQRENMARGITMPPRCRLCGRLPSLLAAATPVIFSASQISRISLAPDVPGLNHVIVMYLVGRKPRLTW